MTETIETVRLEAQLDSLKEILELHTAQDEANFGVLNRKLDALSSSIEIIKLEFAREAGERKGREDTIKRGAAVISTVVSTAVLIAGLILNHFVG